MRNLKLAVVFAVAVALAACSDDGNGPTDPTPEVAVGTYILASINNHPMPFPLIVAPAFGLLVEYTFSRIDLTQVGGYQARDIVTEKNNNVVARVDTIDTAGRWIQRDTLISFIDLEGTDTLNASLRSGKLTYRITFATDAGDSTYVFVYQKQ